MYTIERKVRRVTVAIFYKIKLTKGEIFNIQGTYMVFQLFVSIWIFSSRKNKDDNLSLNCFYLTATVYSTKKFIAITR